MNVLVIGSGGREHALAWKLSQSPKAEKVFVAPGNAGTARDAINVDIGVSDFPALIQFAQDNDIGLTVVGPEVPLCEGIVDEFKKHELPIFGPSKEAAQLEGSKLYTKKVCRAANVDTASHWRFEKASEAILALEEMHQKRPDDVPLVVKADGLAAGKGAIVCSDLEEAKQAIEKISVKRELGAAGDTFLLEEKLTGFEVSVLAISDGKSLVVLPPAQDHKAAYDNDQGPNTGGMGAYCPTAQIDDEMMERILEEVLVPTIHTMKHQKNPFTGVLYAGMMIGPKGPKLLEYNVRFGDPECQPVLMRLDSDLLEIMLATVEGRLSQIEPPTWNPKPTVCVVMASDGYPNKYETGHEITGIEQADQIEGVKVFHAGTKLGEDGQTVLTAGGRVLAVTASGENVAQAKAAAYQAVRCIRWKGAWCRKDIADKAMAGSGV